MRTQEQILTRIEERKVHDVIGFEVSEYVGALTYEHAKPYLRDGVTAEQYGEPTFPDVEHVRCAMRDYVDFAYEKIDDERGISANRTILHYIGWLWLAGEDELLAWVEREYDTNYHAYGRHIVDEIVKRLGLRDESPLAAAQAVLARDQAEHGADEVTGQAG